MLFNSYEFLFLFLPGTLLVYFLIARLGREAGIAWLVVASMFFYGWWNPIYLFLLAGSMLANFYFGKRLSAARAHNRSRTANLWLALGVTFNLGLLGSGVTPDRKNNRAFRWQTTSLRRCLHPRSGVTSALPSALSGFKATEFTGAQGLLAHFFRTLTTCSAGTLPARMAPSPRP